MKTVTVHEAKTHLSRLLREVEAGEEIVIKRGNKVVARLTAPKETREESAGNKPGLWSDLAFSEEENEILLAPLIPEEITGWEHADPLLVSDHK